MTSPLDIELKEKLIGPILATLEPMLIIELENFAEEYIQLLTVRTPWKGKLSLENSPYMCGAWGPLWAWKRYEYISNIWGTQTGKTTILFIILCYIVRIDPGDIKIVIPDRNFGRDKSKKDIMPLIRDNLQQFLTKDEDDFQLLEYIFKHMTVSYGWSGSPSSLAGDPCKYVLNDETGKNQKKASEGDSYALGDRRRQAYGKFGKNYMGTTPSLEALPGWRELIDGCWAENRVPCHSCGKHQVMRKEGFLAEFDSLPDIKNPEDGAGGIDWDKSEGLTIGQRAASAHYKCVFCGEKWNTSQKKDAVFTNYDFMRIDKLIARKENGAPLPFTLFWNGFKATEETSLDELHLQKMAIANYKAYWKPRDAENEKYSSQLPSWYSVSVEFDQIVESYLKGEQDPGLMQDHINADCAEYYDLQGASEGVEFEELKKLRGDYKKGAVPVDNSVALFMTVDVHKSHIDVRVRAWCQDQTSYGVDYVVLLVKPGRPLLEDLDAIFNRTYKTPSGSEVGIDFALVDAGYKPEEVYEFCLRHHGRAFPIKGGSYRDLFKFTTQIVEAKPELNLHSAGTLHMVNFDDNRWHHSLTKALRIPTEDSPGRFFFEEDVSDELLHQVSSVRLVTETNKKTGRLDTYWKNLGENHGFDIEKYQCLAALVFNVADGGQRQQQAKKSAPAPEVDNPYTNEY